MFDQSGIQVVILVNAFIAAALLVVYASRRKRDTGSGIQYAWLAVIGSSNAESAEDTYRSAYILLTTGLRMELMMVRMEMAEFALTRGGGRPRIVERITYTTEEFRPYLNEIKSLEDFGLYAPYREGWMTMMKLSVHPDDLDEAVRALEKAGLTVQIPSGQHWWH